MTITIKVQGYRTVDVKADGFRVQYRDENGNCCFTRGIKDLGTAICLAMDESENGKTSRVYIGEADGALVVFKDGKRIVDKTADIVSIRE